MMRKTHLTGMAVAFFLLGPLVMVGTASGQGILEACESDIDAHCSSVKPGNGRLAACLYAFEDQLTPRCDSASSEVADIIDAMFYELRQAWENCSDDVESLCKNVDAGGGRLLQCLIAESANLKPMCASSVERYKDTINP